MNGSEYNNSSRYLTRKEYNEKLTANEKRALYNTSYLLLIRRISRAESFILKEDKMYYRVGEGALLTSFTCSWQLSIFTAK
jgi:CTP:phosphocholine cytidylyltransferase-like protein